MGPQDLSDVDATQLSQLAIAFRAVGSLVGCCANFGWLYAFMGAELAKGGFEGSKGPPPGFGYLFGIMGVVGAVGGIALGICSWIAAKSLENRTNYTLCFVVALFLMLFQPIGTVLGILALIVLARPAVKAAFESKPPHVLSNTQGGTEEI